MSSRMAWRLSSTPNQRITNWIAGRCSLIYLQHGQKSFLRNLDPADFLHPLLTFFLLLEQFAFARDVATVAFRDHVLAHRLNCFARDDFIADGRLDRDLKQLSRD